jgi:hypothetical protein
MICLIMSYDYDDTIDEVILGMMERIFPSNKVGPNNFNYTQYFSDVIHNQFLQFASLKCF